MHCLLGFLRNRLAPINQIPPEILGLIPDFLDIWEKERDIIALTQVCRAWREIFTSRSSLWTRLDCKGPEKTEVYLKRSKSSPIDLAVHYSGQGLFPYDSLFRVIPHALGRLRSLHFNVSLIERLDDITARLSHPAPLLEALSMETAWSVLPPTLFAGDLSSLCKLQLRTTITDLPWRNMVNLLSFDMGRMHNNQSAKISVNQLLDFLESAPRLSKINLCYATDPTSCGQDGRLVSLANLREMEIDDEGPCSSLLDHLLIPVGARLRTNTRSTRAEDHFPRSLGNLNNLPNFTKIILTFWELVLRMEFTGPNGEVDVVSDPPQPSDPLWILDCLALLDTSNTEQLKVVGNNLPSASAIYQALSPMRNLHTLTFGECNNPFNVIHSLSPPLQPSSIVICPKLERIDFYRVANNEKGIIQGVVGMAASRASRGARLKTVRIHTRRDIREPEGVSELRKYVLHVEHHPGWEI
jgi:hypothetical protein